MAKYRRNPRNFSTAVSISNFQVYVYPMNQLRFLNILLTLQPYFPSISFIPLDLHTHFITLIFTPPLIFTSFSFSPWPCIEPIACKIQKFPCRSEDIKKVGYLHAFFCRTESLSIPAVWKG